MWCYRTFRYAFGRQLARGGTRARLTNCGHCDAQVQNASALLLLMYVGFFTMNGFGIIAWFSFKLCFRHSAYCKRLHGEAEAAHAAEACSGSDEGSDGGGATRGRLVGRASYRTRSGGGAAPDSCWGRCCAMMDEFDAVLRITLGLPPRAGRGRRRRERGRGSRGTGRTGAHSIPGVKWQNNPTASADSARPSTAPKAKAGSSHDGDGHAHPRMTGVIAAAGGRASGVQMRTLSEAGADASLRARQAAYGARSSARGEGFAE